MITGLRAIWGSLGNRFYIILFTILATISALLLVPQRYEYQLMIGSLILGGIIFFLLLAFLSLFPPLRRAIERVQRLVILQVILYAIASLVAPVILRNMDTLADLLINSGFTMWLILQSLLACALAYYVSTKISTRSPHFLGWVFIMLAVILEVGLFYEAFRHPLVSFLLYIYTAAWFAPCIALALLGYHSPRLFSAFSLMALAYTAFPVAYRIFLYLNMVSLKPGGFSFFLSNPLIDQAITVVLFIIALNALGNFFGHRYLNPGDKGKKVIFGLPVTSEDAPAESVKRAGEPTNEKSEVVRDGRRHLLPGSFLIFGLLFSALAYFAFVNARGAFHISPLLEPMLSFIISVIVTVPLLFYVMRTVK